jgi:thiol:disulfide interchange protein DsbC
MLELHAVREFIIAGTLLEFGVSKLCIKALRVLLNNPEKIMRLKSIIASACLALLAAGTLFAGELAEKYSFVAELFPDYEVTRVVETPVAGLLEVTLGSQVVYISADGKYILTGEMYDYETRTSLTQASLMVARAGYLDGFKDDGAITFVAEDEQYRVLVFTDIDCPYCRKLHREISEYNEQGITVQYLAFPRKGPGSESWEKAELVWCSDNPQQAMNQAKGGRDIDGGECAAGENPVAEQYKLGKELGIAGTPAIFKESGEMIVGYKSADELVKLLASEDES